MLPLHTRMSNNLQAHALKLVPAPICSIFFRVRSLFLAAHNKIHCSSEHTMMSLYSPVAGAVARLALLVTVSPRTLSSLTWFLFISFSSFFLLSVLSLLTCGAPLLVAFSPGWSGEKGPGGPRSDSILGHILIMAGGKDLFSPRRKDSPDQRCITLKSL